MWRGNIICVLLVIEDQDHFAREPVKIRHLLRLYAVVMVGYQMLNRFPALSDRACYNEFVQHLLAPIH